MVATVEETPKRSNRIRWFVRGAILIGLIGLTVWNLTRADALNEALASYPPANQDDIGALRLTLRRATDRLARRPDDPKAALLAARCLTRLHYDLHAEQYYEIVQRAGLLGLDDLRARAEGLTNTHRFEMAAPVNEAILRLDPDDAVALRRLGGTRFAQQRYEEAIELGKRLAKIPGSEETGWLLLGSVYQEKLRADDAADAYEQVLKIDPELSKLGSLPTDMFWSDYTESMLMAASGRAAVVRKTLENAIKTRESGLLWDLLGRAYQEESAENSIEEAERCYRKAIEIEPELAVAWKHLGILQSVKQPKEAIETLERADALGPNDVQTLHHLGLIHNRLGHNVQAKDYMKRAAEARSKLKLKGGMGA